MELTVVGGVAVLVLLVLGYRLGALHAELRWKARASTLAKEASAEAVKKSRGVLAGQFAEQLAPFLPGFRWSPSEARFLGKPIDFVVFRGLDEGRVDEVVFVEVKSGASTLSTPERRLRDAIKKRRVRWVEYRVPTKVTRRRAS